MSHILILMPVVLILRCQLYHSLMGVHGCVSEWPLAFSINIDLIFPTLVWEHLWSFSRKWSHGQMWGMQWDGCSEWSLFCPVHLHLHWPLAHLGKMGNGSFAFLPSGRRKEAIRAADSSENSQCGSISLQISWLLWVVQAFLTPLLSWQVKLACINTQWCWKNTWHGQDCSPHGQPALEFATEKILFHFETILDLQKCCRDHGNSSDQHCTLLSH